MNLKKLERYLRVNLLGLGPHLIKKKKNLPGRGLTNFEKHCSTPSLRATQSRIQWELVLFPWVKAAGT